MSIWLQLDGPGVSYYTLWFPVAELRLLVKYLERKRERERSPVEPSFNFAEVSYRKRTSRKSIDDCD